jgi:MFS superfamily sulfate permease-like transporter
MNAIQIGLANLKEHWKDDLKSGFNVSLIALPLSLGIALASGFPPIAGIFAAIIGGMVVSRLNGSFVTIVGPAAGLIVVNISAIEMLGQGDNVAGYKYALSAIFVAGIIITLFGFLKAGKFGDFFPTAAVHGMLAAIGIIIIVKQFFVAVAVRAHGHEFYEIMTEIPIALKHANPEVILIALVSLLILIFYPKTNNRIIRIIPAPVWVLIVAIPLEFLLDFEHEHSVIFLGEAHKVGPQLLVHLPDKLSDGFALPDFGKFLTGAFWISVTTIALVTALESVLSAIAVDSLDPMQRKTNLNKDLKALGAGSSFSSLIGGLPMISEIVRSSANVSGGGKTQWSNFFHGSFLLLFLLIGGPIINHIPLSALAAMLLFTGYRLASPKEFKHVYETGKAELVVFVITIIMVLVTDLVIGVGVGILVNLVFCLLKGTSIGNLFKVRLKEESVGSQVVLKPSGTLVFSNYLGLKKKIMSHGNTAIILDMSNLKLIDHSVMHHLHNIEKEYHVKDVDFEIINDNHLRSETNHPLSAKIAIKSTDQYEVLSLSDHQVALAKLAVENGWGFKAEKTIENNKMLRSFHFAKKGLMHFAQNTIKGNVDHVAFEFFEIEFDADAQTKSATNIIPTVIIKSDKRLPVFTAEEESFFDKLAELSGFNDIDFENHPIFSDKFLLKGPDEEEIRKFFTADLIGLLESHPKFHFESDGKTIMIYRFDGKDDIASLKELIEFCKSLIPVLGMSHQLLVK